MSAYLELSEKLHAISHTFRIAIRDQANAKEMGLKGMHARLLHMIKRIPDCTANHIVTQMDRDKAQVARLVKEMIELGLVEKSPNPNDKRSQLLRLSPDGEALHNKMEEAESVVATRACQGIPEEDLASFLNGIDTMLTNLKTTESE